MSGTTGGLANGASGLLSPLTGAAGSAGAGLLSPVAGTVGAAGGLLGPIAGGVGTASGLLSPVTGAVGAASGLLDSMAGSLGGATGLLNPVTSTVGGITGIQIGGQLVPLNAVGQIIGLSESPLNAQGTVNTLEQSGAGVSGAYEPIINYLQSDNPDSMEPSAARSNGDVNDDAMGLVAQPMLGGEHGSDSGEYDGASWNKGWVGRWRITDSRRLRWGRALFQAWPRRQWVRERLLARRALGVRRRRGCQEQTRRIGVGGGAQRLARRARPRWMG